MEQPNSGQMEQSNMGQMEQSSSARQLGSEQKDQSSERLERGYKIRQITQIQPSWKEGTRGEPGKFFVQLVLDSGVDEYIIQPTATDVSQLLKMFAQSKYTIWDDERKIIIFENIAAK